MAPRGRLIHHRATGDQDEDADILVVVQILTKGEIIVLKELASIACESRAAGRCGRDRLEQHGINVCVERVCGDLLLGKRVASPGRLGQQGGPITRSHQVPCLGNGCQDRIGSKHGIQDGLGRIHRLATDHAGRRSLQRRSAVAQ